MTDSMFALLGLFVLVMGFLVTAAYILERWPSEDPLAERIERRLR